MVCEVFSGSWGCGTLARLCAPRGLQNEPNPMQPLELVREWEAQAPESRRGLQVPDVNHYTIAVGRRGAEAVAAEIARSITPTAA